MPPPSPRHTPSTLLHLRLPIVLLVLLLTLHATPTHSTTSPKRGIVYVDPASPSDDTIWSRPSNGLTWYYNYHSTPTPSLLKSAPHLSFVPMEWGASPSNSDTTFLSSIKDQLSSGANISHILGFNEPDGPASTGGSSLPPAVAAASWLRNIAPLRLPPYNLKAGLPAVTGSPRGITWLEAFNTSCLALNPGEGCAGDFLPIHFYGDFAGLASHLGQMRALYPRLGVWVTEFGLPEKGLADTQAAFNTSLEYLDRLAEVERYSWFGAFRSSRSNVGVNAVFLDGQGQLTDLGSWYLGGRGPGKVPSRREGGRARGWGIGAGIVVVVVGMVGVVVDW